MIYHLDTNVIVEILNNPDSKVLKTLLEHSHKDIKIPSMVIAEMTAGAYKCRNAESRLENIRKIFTPFETVPFDGDAAKIYGKVRADLEMKGNVIGPNDIIIAATVLSHGGTLVTNNTREFERVEGLLIEDWC